MDWWSVGVSIAAGVVYTGSLLWWTRRQARLEYEQRVRDVVYNRH